MEMTRKENDRQMILAYLRGKGVVSVADIIANSGAEKLRVYTILFEEEQKDNVEFVETEVLGAPVAVRLRDE